MLGKKNHRAEQQPAAAVEKSGMTWPDDGSPALEDSHAEPGRPDSKALRQTGANVFFSGVSGGSGF